MIFTPDDLDGKHRATKETAKDLQVTTLVVPIKCEKALNTIKSIRFGKKGSTN